MRFPAIVLFLSASNLAAQIILTSAYFPEVGDSLLTNQATDAYRDGITFKAPGADLTWDFGTPEKRREITEVLEAVVNDTFFVDADARLSSPAFDYEYYQTTDTSYNLVGLMGTLPFLRDTVLSTRITPPRPVKRANITYGDRFASTSIRELRIHTDSLPLEVKNSSAGAVLATYDTLRIVNTSVRNDEVDAYGTLRLAGKDYPVLREKRVEQLETRVYLKSGDGAYTDFTDLIKTFDPTSGQYVGQQPKEGTYYFWAQGVKEPIVEIEFDEAEKPTTFLYIRGERMPTSVREDVAVRSMSLHPNPTTRRFTLNYALARSAAVDLALYDAQGRRVTAWAPEQQSSGPHRLEGSLESLPIGIYFLELKTDTGRTMRKLVKQ